MDKTFAVAGISSLEGVAKVRFAKDLARVKVLEKNGHKNIKLVELPKAMDKVAAVAHLMSHAQFKDAASQAVLKAYASDEKPAKAEKAPKAKAEKPAAKKAKVAAPKVEKSAEEVEAIKAKNLQTLKKVHARIKAAEARDAEVVMQDAGEEDHEDIRELELNIPALANRETNDELDG